jgi:hypothetical protein
MSFSRGHGLTLESTGRMVPVDLYSVMCVRDRTTSQKWFEVFFGRPADELIGEEYLWKSSTRTATACRSRRCRPGNPSPASVG